jgi:imidazolonepropionase-like amidohydrolase
LRRDRRAGADVLTHCDISGRESIPDATIKLIANRHLPYSALLMTNRYVEWVTASPPPLYQDIIRAKDQNDRRLIAAGATLVLATDAGLLGPKGDANPLLGAMFAGAKDLPTHLGDAHWVWIRAAIERGLTPMDALLAATRNVAQAYGRSKDLGTLEVGKHADLLVLGEDPLANPDNYQRILDVYQDGLRIDRDALPTKHIMTPP